ncbi:MAG: serine/threonine protein kinase, partial [Flavobacteriales bacterium]|nr:serine/threonine protein kinase [Flavobacteriales bacterium]
MDFSERYKYDPQKDFIGTGGFSKIFRAYDNLREHHVALKFFSGEVKEKYSIIAEAKRLLKLDHTNVIRFYDLESVAFTNIHMQRENVLIGVLEYIDGGDLKQGIDGQLTLEQKYQIIKGILDGLKYIHSKNLIHRDLKPGNIMLHYQDADIIPKLIDFGISKNTGDGQTVSSELLGTVEYMAPEQFNAEKYGGITPATDLWSLGVMIYELFTGNQLFIGRGSGQQTEQIISKILFDELPVDFDHLPSDIQQVLKRCLVRNAKNRVQRVDELIELLNQPKKEPALPTEKKAKPVITTKEKRVEKSSIDQLKDEENLVFKQGPEPKKQLPPTKESVEFNAVKKTRIAKKVEGNDATKVLPSSVVKAVINAKVEPVQEKPIVAPKENVVKKESPFLNKKVLVALGGIAILVIIILVFFIPTDAVEKEGIADKPSTDKEAEERLEKGKFALLQAAYPAAESHFRLADQLGSAEASFMLGFMFVEGKISDPKSERSNIKLNQYIKDKQLNINLGELTGGGKIAPFHDEDGQLMKSYFYQDK